MAWNEPGPNKDPWNQGPKKGQQGPPDLDEMLKRLKARFGGKGGGAPGLPQPGLMFWVAVGVVVVLWAFSGFFVVDEQEKAVVLRFGEQVDTREPGLSWHWPWPIENEEIVNVTGVRSIMESATMLTKDENIVNVELSVQYRISDVVQYLFSLEEPDMTLRQVTRAAVREVVGRSTMDDILVSGRRTVGEDTKALIQERLGAYKSGLVVTEVNLQQAQPPDEVQAAFADAIKAREDEQRLINEAQAYEKDRVPKAEGAAARQKAEAVGYQQQAIARAEGEASRFTQLLAEYKKAPKVTRQRLYLESMNSVLANSSKILLDVDKGNPMLYLPLDQIMKNATNPDALMQDYSATPGAQAAPRSGATDPSRSRDRGRP